jgi:ABC-type thiamine transport system substrate-binding protein
VEKDINVDAEARQEFTRRKLEGVPAFIIGEDVVVGLDKAKILALVDHRVIECEQCHTKLRVPTNRGSLKVTCPKCKNVFDWTPR